jgi:hypothetical protein
MKPPTVVSEPLTDRHHQLEQFSSAVVRSTSGSDGMSPRPVHAHRTNLRLACPGTISWLPRRPVTVLHRSFLAQVPGTVARAVEGSKRLR